MRSTLGQEIQVGDLRVELERIVARPPRTTLDFTSFMDTPNDGTDRLFFSELGGILPDSTARIRMLEHGAFSTFLDLSDEAYFAGETGFLGFTFHPDYANSESPGYGKLYTYHSVQVDPDATADFPETEYAAHHQNLLTEWQVDPEDPSRVDTSTRREVFRESHAGGVHAGGMLEFGSDGYLYGAIGSPRADPWRGQEKSNIQGSIFRIDPLAPASTPSSGDAVSPNGEYRIPADNPFVGESDVLGEIWAYGLRSPYRFSHDPVTGLMFAADVGETKREEVNVVRPGDNLGWPHREGSLEFLPREPEPGTVLVEPIAEYTHDDGISIIGGYVYRGSIPELQGKYIFGELSYGPGNRLQEQGRLLWIDPYNEEGEVKSLSETRIQEIATGPETCADTYNSPGDCTFDGMLTSFAVDDEGELYVFGYRDHRTVVYKFADAYFLPDGDYNQDGVVDAADYAVWRDTLGSTEDLRANGDDTGASQGVIDAADYAVWKAQYGVRAVEAVAAPEPSASALLTAFALVSALPSARSTRSLS